MERILFVDDDPNLLQGYRRRLCRVFRFDTALGAELGLQTIAREPEYAVICADMRMPGMNGIDFLRHVKDRSPDSVRLMLTGTADLSVAQLSVNKGRVFRFLTKPCPPDQMAEALVEGVQKYRLEKAEKDLLGRTLKGCVDVLAEVLALSNPVAFSQASLIRDYVGEVCRELQLKDVWQFEVAALLSQIGCIVLAPEILERLYRREPLREEEKEAFDAHPSLGGKLIGKIPRLEEVAKSIAYQEKRFDGSGNPLDSRKGEDIPLGGRILKVVCDQVTLESAGIAPLEAIQRLGQRFGWYDPRILKALSAAVRHRHQLQPLNVAVSELYPGMILDQDVSSSSHRLLLGKGHTVTSLLCERLQSEEGDSSATIRVLAPDMRSGEGDRGV